MAKASKALILKGGYGGSALPVALPVAAVAHWRTGALAQWPQNREPRASASGRRAAGRATGHWPCSATASSGSDGQLTVFKS